MPETNPKYSSALIAEQKRGEWGITFLLEDKKGIVKSTHLVMVDSGVFTSLKTQIEDLKRRGRV